jgi:putative DNA primase/helicase
MGTLKPNLEGVYAVLKEAIGVISPITENIPEELTERPQWVLWRLEMRDGKPTKVPYTPGEDTLASSTDSLTWTTFDKALAAYQAGGYGGIGFVFSSGDPFVGVDLDYCRDPQSGEIAPWAQKAIARVQEGYIEISPSGTGIHIIVEGKMRAEKTQRKIPGGGKIEMYCQARFFTITGFVL